MIFVVVDGIVDIFKVGVIRVEGEGFYGWLRFVCYYGDLYWFLCRGRYLYGDFGFIIYVEVFFGEMFVDEVLSVLVVVGCE